jgi:hypothetical protein
MFPGGSFATMVPVTCEVCETPQPPATVCAVCGLPLHVPRGVRLVGDPPIVPMPDLEPTRFDEAIDYGSVAIPDLEPTVMEAAPELPPFYLPGFESTTDQLLDLPGEDPVMPDLERTSEPFLKSAPPPAGQPAGCPYCGFEQASGRMCNNCGRSRIRVLPPEPAVKAVSKDDASIVRCRSCGAKVPLFKLCSDCGMPLPDLE